MAQNTSNKRRAVTIHPPARLVGEPKKTKKERKEGRKKERHPKQWRTGYSPSPPTSSNQNQTLRGGWPAVCSYTCQVLSKSVKGLRRCGGRKWPFPITLASGLYNSLYYRTSRVDIGTFFRSIVFVCAEKNIFRPFHWLESATLLYEILPFCLSIC